MRISQIPDTDLMRTFKYICNLCGYPEVSQDKSNVLIKFMRENHGHNTDAELIDSFTALAAGRLDEKQDSIKALTGLTASKVIQAYTRQKKISTRVDETPEGKTMANDETIRLVREYSGRIIRYDQEINSDEHRMLMDHWIAVQRENFKTTKRVDILTSTAFDYLEANGSLRVKDGSFQAWNGKMYIDICPWQQVEEIAQNTKKMEDHQAMMRRNLEFRRMGAVSAGDSIEKVTKRIAVSIFFEHIT